LNTYRRVEAVKDRPKIIKIEVHQFEFQFRDIGLEPTISIPIYEPGAVISQRAHAIRIFTNLGVTGEYVGGSAVEYSALPRFAPSLIGRDALGREAIYNDAKQALQIYAHNVMGLSQVDIALWDLAGKFYEAPIYELLGAYRTSLPCYASTLTGDSSPGGLDSPEAYADFAQQCLEMGYPAYKIHPWAEAPIERTVAAVHAVGKRVGGKMDLMLDPFCAPKTFGDALKVGWACDEERFFWWEDPFRDGGISAFAHRKLRQLVRTPLLQLEHLRGLEPHVDFIVADGTDFVRGDPDYDGGITGVMKIAHAAEGFGLDVELHHPGPVRRHLMAAIRNSNYYEMVLVHPRVPFLPNVAPVYKDGYRDSLDAIDENGCVEVPQGPGLGVEYDWDYITEHSTGVTVYE
jgi:L-alanine-DL-glutamate epimerase-like enolase superfamily enzyme